MIRAFLIVTALVWLFEVAIALLIMSAAAGSAGALWSQIAQAVQ